jgi:TatD DNase family protein
VPYRGKRNEPAYVAATAATLADVKGISTDALAQATTQNVLRLFSKMPPLTEPASA